MLEPRVRNAVEKKQFHIYAVDNISEGMEIRKAIRFAQAAASIAVTRPGAQQSAPSREDVEKVLNESNE